jgi:hypothetical protein
MEKEHWCAHLVPFTTNAEDIIITTPAPAWKFIPTINVVCDGDLMVPCNLQQAAIKSAQQWGALVDEEFLEGCGHSPNLSAAESILLITIAAAAKCSSTEPHRLLSSSSSSPVTEEEV